MKPGYYMALAGLLLTSDAIADDVSHGKQLHDQHCVACHGSEVYTREDRRISSIDALGEQVRRCEFNLELQWFDDDVQAVIEHMNSSFYQFEQNL